LISKEGIMEAGKAPDGVSAAELREAEEGLRRLLFAKRFSRAWIERHVPEVMAQAHADFAARLAAGKEDETIGLLVVIAYRRALKVLRSEGSAPATVSVEEVFHLADKAARTPEEEAIDNERQARLLKAIGHLPDRERKLLGLVYFAGHDVKEAGRRVGWSPSSAVRHQRSALERLRRLVGERELLGAEVAVPAFILSGYTLPEPSRLGWLEAAASQLREVAALWAQRLVPAGEAGNALAASGAGRTTAGVCGLAVAACLTAVTSGVVGPGVGVIDSGNSPARPSGEPAPALEAKRASPPAAEEPASLSPRAQEPAASRPSQSEQAGARASNRTPRHSAGRSEGRSTSRGEGAGSGEQELSEFGLEGEGSQASAPPAADESSPVSAASPAPAPSPPPSSSSADAGAGEFGM
jgi:RNA polymerase sigma factor (sigma-70 family)